MILLEFRPEIRLAFALIPTDWTYMPRADFFRRIVITATQTAVITIGVGTGPRKLPKKAYELLRT
jgi:hypothetical protein